MSIANFIIKLGLDATSYHAGLKKAESAAHHFAKENVSAVKSALAEAFTIGAVIEFTKSVVEAGAAIKDLAEQTGLTTDEVQDLQVAAKNAGLDVEKYLNALIRVKAAQAAALSGNQTEANKFKALGISPNANPLDVLRKAGEAKSAEELAAAFDLIGVKAGRILKSLGEIKALGPLDLISQEDIERLDKADKTWERIWRRMKVSAAPEIATQLFSLDAFMTAFGQEREKFRRWAGFSDSDEGSKSLAGRMTTLAASGGIGFRALWRMFEDKSTASGESSTPAADDARLHPFIGFGVHRDGPTMDWRAGRERRRAEQALLNQDVRERFYGPVLSGNTDIGGVRLSGGANYFQRAQIAALQSIEKTNQQIALNTASLNTANEEPMS